MTAKSILGLVFLLVSFKPLAGVSANSETCDLWAQMADQIYALRVEGYSADELTKITEQHIEQNPRGLDKGSMAFLLFSDMIRLSVQIGNLSYEKYPDSSFREEQARESCVAMAGAAGYSEHK